MKCSKLLLYHIDNKRASYFSLIGNGVSTGPCIENGQAWLLRGRCRNNGGNQRLVVHANDVINQWWNTKEGKEQPSFTCDADLGLTAPGYGGTVAIGHPRQYCKHNIVNTWKRISIVYSDNIRRAMYGHLADGPWSGTGPPGSVHHQASKQARQVRRGMWAQPHMHCWSVTTATMTVTPTWPVLTANVPWIP